MAVLPEIDRKRIRMGLVRYWSRRWESTGSMGKGDIKPAVDATDAWIEANQASYNAALPATFRNNATMEQKTLLLCAVALMRVSLNFLRRIFGEVD